MGSYLADFLHAHQNFYFTVWPYRKFVKVHWWYRQSELFENVGAKEEVGKNKTDVPIAKKNKNAELVTNHAHLQALYKNTFEKRMEHRIIKPELKQMYQ